MGPDRQKDAVFRRLLGPPPPAEVDNQLIDCHQQEHQPEGDGKEPAGVGEVVRRVPPQLGQLQVQEPEDQKNHEQLAHQHLFPHGPVDVVHLGYRVGVDGDGVLPVGAEDLHDIPPQHQPPPVLGAQLLLLQLLLAGFGVKLRGPGEIGHGESELLRGDFRIGPEQIARLLDHPAPGSHLFQLPLDGFWIVKGNIDQSPLHGAHKGSSFPSRCS